MFKVNNKDTRTTPMALSFIVNFEHILHLDLVFQLLTLSRLMTAGNVKNNKVLKGKEEVAGTVTVKMSNQGKTW